MPRPNRPPIYQMHAVTHQKTHNFCLLCRKCLDILQEFFPTPKRGKRNPQTVFQIRPPRSPDLGPLYFYLWRHLKSLVYSSPIENEETLHQRIFHVCQIINHHSWTFEAVQQCMIRRVHACTDSGGTHFEHLLWTATWYITWTQQVFNLERVCCKCIT